MTGLQQAQTYAQSSSQDADFLYLRLFYTEEFLGWNSEDLESHIAWSSAAVVVAAVLM
jgi:hypothetical protein